MVRIGDLNCFEDIWGFCVQWEAGPQLNMLAYHIQSLSYNSIPPRNANHYDVTRLYFDWECANVRDWMPKYAIGPMCKKSKSSLYIVFSLEFVSRSRFPPASSARYNYSYWYFVLNLQWIDNAELWDIIFRGRGFASICRRIKCTLN